MQSLEVISVNLWQILISLCNLLLLFLILKKFLYKPVKKALAQRKSALDEKYSAADADKAEASQLKQQWEEKMANAENEAGIILQTANENAELRKNAILDETHERAERILRQAETDAELERKKAQADIKKDIVDVSTALTEKMLGREITADDHHRLIDSFLSEIGDENDGDK